MILCLISLFLENSWSLIFPKTSIFLGLFCLVSLAFTYPLFKDDKKYLIFSFIYGFIYDISFTDTIFLNMILFSLVAYLIIKIEGNVEFGFVISLITGTSLIVLYRFITYITIISLNNLSFNWLELFQSIYSSLIVSLIYLLILKYIISKRLKHKNVIKYKNKHIYK